jgi:hypothetical protein
LTISYYLADALLDMVLSKDPFTPPAFVYAAAMTASPSSSGGGVEVAASEYGRVLTTWEAAAGGIKKNPGVVSFPTANSSWGSIVSVALYDASTGGNLLMFGATSPPQNITSGVTLEIPAENMVASLGVT